MPSEAHAAVEHFIGGNDLETAPPSRVADFVKSQGGHSVISKILIANNGIAAVKEIRSVRKWCYEQFGDERAVEFTVMATPEDLKVNADYIRMADRFVEVPGGTNNNNYANVDLIVDVAERSGVHAVWAGWGHASENPRLPESLAASPNKIIFIGPPGSAMRSLGDKISSTIVAQHADVPCMPWSGSGITDTEMSPQGFVTVPDGPYQAACVKTFEDGIQRAEKIGYPVMIKASEGGGGKGIRMVHSSENFKTSFQAVASEVPGSPIFVMALAGSARHLEVQLLADQYGNAISLFGRDCSVQRRHQKIIEEAPVTIAHPERFEEMEKAAVRLAKLVGYVSAGTVEYLYSHADDSFFFLELNPRLQVEHPTTEMVSGVNLPAAQLQIAMGISLHRIRDIRVLYGLDPHSGGDIDFDYVKPESVTSQRKPRPKGHVVACRITSENPDEGFKPSGGDIQELNFRSNTNVWGYFSVGAAGGIHSFADSQFGHVFAYGSDRPTARKNMVVALKELSIRGDFRTTVEYLITLLETADFEQNTITTAWLDGLISKKLTSERPDTNLAVICGAVVKAHVASEACWAEYRRILDKGQVPSKDSLKTVFTFDFIYEGVRYNFTAARAALNTYRLYVNGGKTVVGIRPLADGGMLVLLDGRSHTLYWREDVGTLRIQVDAKTCLIEQENDPTQLRSPSPGKIVKFLVDSGDHVNAGEVFAEIEVMKMIMPLIAQEAGHVQFVKQPGVTVDPGAIIAILSLDDPSRVKKAKPFEGMIPDMGLPNVLGTKSHQQLAAQLASIHDILDGFEADNANAILRALHESLKNPELAFGEALSILSTLSGRMPADLEDDIRESITLAQQKPNAEFPAQKILKQIDRFVEATRPQERAAVRLQVESIQALAFKNIGGIKGYASFVYASILQQYLTVETVFASGSEEAVVLTLRDSNRESLNDVLGLVLSHSRVASRSKLMLAILETIQNANLNTSEGSPLQKVLKALADMPSKINAASKVSLKAREILISSSLPSYEERRLQMEKILVSSVTTSYYGESGGGHKQPSIDILNELSNSRFTVYDVLSFFFKHEDPWVVLASLTVYVLRAYREYSILDIQQDEGEDGAAGVVTWRFKLNHATPETSTPRIDSSRDVYRVGSMSDLTYKIKQSQTEPLRTGVMTSFNNLAELKAGFKGVLANFSSFNAEEFAQRHGKDVGLPNILNVAIRAFDTADDMTDAEWQTAVSDLVTSSSADILKRGVRRVTFLVCRKGVYPSYFTYRQEPSSTAWKEEEKIRNIEPALASQLELNRLSNFNVTPIFVENRQIHIYKAEGKENSSDVRFFIRALVRPGRLQDTTGSMRTAEYLISECDRLVTDIMDALEVVGAESRNADCNHVAINFIYNVLVDFDDVQEALAGFIERHGKRLWRLRVTAAEIRMSLEDDEGNITPIRCCIENVSGFVVKYHAYQEIETDKGTPILRSIGEPGPFHLQSVNHPYMTKNSLQPRRYQAHLVGTTYVYDYPDLFIQSLRRVWADAATKIPNLRVPNDPLTFTELVLDENNDLQEVERPPGSNTCGMVAWIFTMLTPEYPKGRRAVVIANDITFKIGSFGPLEDDYFFKATEIAKKLGLPRIYLSANSGARLGIAEELLNLFKAAFNDDNDPQKGIKYLYLTPETLATLSKKGSSVITEEIEEAGERRHKITDIIGLQDGLGVESLRGSGLIAGATSRAYDEGIFTISLVTARSVGIGAYLVRLGQRSIQVEGNPLILTGAQALNKVLGREVYTSNLQLGGTQIMARNGTSHLVAESDLDGALKVIQWLAYVPERKGKPIPISPSQDSWDREVTYAPPKGPYDPRWLLQGNKEEGLTGLFDDGSFFETLGDWAKAIVCGRARLGGIPVGVIAVETRTTERTVPADPANPAGFEQKILEAGQVWTPNSAYKTAQAIFDIDREGLPLIFLTNMRGFSGGQQDMYDEILKQGAKIVDGLSSFKQPVFIYIVPNGELRGGAWVVLDPTINDAKMEMYADVDARGGILEPSGIVEIKFRRDKILATMARLDPTYASLKADSNDTEKSADERAKAEKDLKAREKTLYPTYVQIATEYADLHDRVGRMEAKGCAKRAVWKESRRFFYWRLRRRLDQEHVLAKLAKANPSFTLAECQAQLDVVVDSTLSDREYAEYIEQSANDINAHVAEVRSAYVASAILDFSEKDRQGALSGLMKVLSSLGPEDKASLVEKLQASL